MSHNIFSPKHAAKSCWLLCWIMIFGPGMWAQNSKEVARLVMVKTITEFADLPQQVQPEIVTLNGKDIRNTRFSPGKYRLDISHPGYFPITDTLMVAPGAEALVIEKKLLARPVQLKFSITHNVSPPETRRPVSSLSIPKTL